MRVKLQIRIYVFLSFMRRFIQRRIMTYG